MSECTKCQDTGWVEIDKSVSKACACPEGRRQAASVRLVVVLMVPSC